MFESFSGGFCFENSNKNKSTEKNFGSPNKIGRDPSRSILQAFLDFGRISVRQW
jgi:hypothetical protein